MMLSSPNMKWMVLLALVCTTCTVSAFTLHSLFMSNSVTPKSGPRPDKTSAVNASTIHLQLHNHNAPYANDEETHLFHDELRYHSKHNPGRRMSSRHESRNPAVIGKRLGASIRVESSTGRYVSSREIDAPGESTHGGNETDGEFAEIKKEMDEMRLTLGPQAKVGNKADHGGEREGSARGESVQERLHSRNGREGHETVTSMDRDAMLAHVIKQAITALEAANRLLLVNETSEQDMNVMAAMDRRVENAEEPVKRKLESEEETGGGSMRVSVLDFLAGLVIIGAVGVMMLGYRTRQSERCERPASFV